MQSPEHYKTVLVITHIAGEELSEPKVSEAPSLGEANILAMCHNWHGTMADKHGNIIPLRDPKRYPNPCDDSSQETTTLAN